MVRNVSVLAFVRFTLAIQETASLSREVLCGVGYPAPSALEIAVHFHIRLCISRTAEQAAYLATIPQGAVDGWDILCIQLSRQLTYRFIFSEICQKQPLHQ